MRVTSGIVSTLQQKTTTGFAPNDRGVASDDLVVDNPMSGRADCTNVGISGHCGLHQGVSGNDTGQAPPRVCFTCDAQLFCLSTICFQQLLSNRRRQGGPLGPSKY